MSSDDVLIRLKAKANDNGVQHMLLNRDGVDTISAMQLCAIAQQLSAHGEYFIRTDRNKRGERLQGLADVILQITEEMKNTPVTPTSPEVA